MLSRSLRLDMASTSNGEPGVLVGDDFILHGPLTRKSRHRSSLSVSRRGDIERRVAAHAHPAHEKCNKDTDNFLVTV
jgi:hypothetical protein